MTEVAGREPKEEELRKEGRKEGMESMEEDGVEIAMLISTRVVRGATKGKQGEDGIRAKDGERSNLRVVRVRIEVPSD